MALFPDYETTPVERALLNNFLGGTDLMQKIEDLERGYARLRKVADRDSWSSVPAPPGSPEGTGCWAWSTPVLGPRTRSRMVNVAATCKFPEED